MMASVEKQTALLVFGMHRSGTSATTRVLNLLGAELSNRVIDPRSDNPKGFWESAEAVDVHDRLLNELSRSWSDIRLLPGDWVNLPVARAALEDLVSLIKRDFSGRSLWVVKDPRMCLLAPLWLEALDLLRIDAKALFVVRNPWEVAESLRVRNRIGYGHAVMMWMQHLAVPERSTRHCARVMITYDQLLQDWRSTMTRVAGGLGIAWPNDMKDIGAVVDDFLDSGDRHHSGDTQALNLAGWGLPKMVIDMYEECLRVSNEGGDWSGLQWRVDEFNRVAELFGAALEETVVESNKAKMQIAELVAYVETRTKDIEAYARQAAKYDELLGDANRRIEEIGSEYESKLTTLAAQLESRAQEIKAYADQAQIYDQLLRESNRRIEQLTSLDGNNGNSVEAEFDSRAQEIHAYVQQAEKYEQLLRDANRRIEESASESEGKLAILAAKLESSEQETSAYARQAQEYDRLLQSLNRRIGELEDGERRCGEELNVLVARLQVAEALAVVSESEREGMAGQLRALLEQRQQHEQQLRSLKFVGARAMRILGRRMQGKRP